jgi:hypothetical protein
MKISETNHKRLAFIKYVFRLAQEQSRLPEPMSDVSLLSFHDSIELFLQLAVEHLDAQKSKSEKTFMDYWGVISAKLQGEPLSHKEALTRLNNARVSFKHHGNLPSQMDIESYRAESADFIEVNSKRIFEVDFAFISLVDLISYRTTKLFLKAAESNLKNKKILESLQESAKAFDSLVNEYENSIVMNSYKKPFQFDRGYFDWLDPSRIEFEALPDGREHRLRYDMKEFVTKANDALLSIKDTLKAMSLGLDYAAFLRFKTVIPKYSAVGTGEYRFHELRDWEKEKLNSEDAEFCVNFILESALDIQKRHFSATSGIRRTAV